LRFIPNASYDQASLFTNLSLTATPGTVSSAVDPQLGFGPWFQAADFGAGQLECRLVGASIAVRNLEAPLSVAGMIAGYTTPSGGTLATSFDYASVLGLSNGQVMSKKENLGQDFTLTIDLDNVLQAQNWHPTPYYLGAASTDGFAYVGIPPSSSTVGVQALVECEEIWEVRGHKVAASAQSHAPPPAGAFDKAQQIVSNILRTAGMDSVPGPVLLSRAFQMYRGIRSMQTETARQRLMYR
jgi:hypothetical protein